MLRKLGLSLIVAAMAVTGCGGDDEPSGAAKDAAEACKRSFSDQPLSDSLKRDLADICTKAAGGDEEEVREASLQVCTKIAEETVPERVREPVLDSCRQTNAKP